MLRDIIPMLGEESTRKRIDQIFSRDTLGSIMLGLTSGKVVEKIIGLNFPTTADKLIGWSVAFVIAFLAFLFWDEMERSIEEAIE